MLRPLGILSGVGVLGLCLLLSAGSLAQNKSKADAAVQDATASSAGGKDSGPKNAGAESPEQKARREKAQEAKQGTYTVRLRDLEDRINRLKEQIFRSKARLSLLAETVLERKIAGAKAVITYRNEMSSAFKLVKATFLLDGGPIFAKSDDSGSLSEKEEISLYDGPVVPGDHTLSVVLEFRGHGYGIFSYLKGYSFTTKSSRTFTIGEAKQMTLEVISYEKGNVTTPLNERPEIRYKENIGELERDQAAVKKAIKNQGGSE